MASLLPNVYGSQLAVLCFIWTLIIKETTSLILNCMSFLWQNTMQFLWTLYRHIGFVIVLSLVNLSNHPG